MTQPILVAELTVTQTDLILSMSDWCLAAVGMNNQELCSFFQREDSCLEKCSTCEFLSEQFSVLD